MEFLVQLSILAWEPVFRSFERVLGPAIYRRLWPDWRAGQRAAVEEVCQGGERMRVWVAEVEANVVGFVAYELHGDKTGEVTLLAVHPDYQNQGIGTELNRVALEEMKESGMSLAKVETGGDPSHAPARRSYEKAGYAALPLVRYFQEL
jgi:ribosomal protein S18 acetylase RimI-like enzyme